MIMCSLNAISGGKRLREGYFFDKNHFTITIELFWSFVIDTCSTYENILKQKETKFIVLLNLCF